MLGIGKQFVSRFGVLTTLKELLLSIIISIMMRQYICTTLYLGLQVCSKQTKHLLRVLRGNKGLGTQLPKTPFVTQKYKNQTEDFQNGQGMQITPMQHIFQVWSTLVVTRKCRSNKRVIEKKGRGRLEEVGQFMSYKISWA